MQCIGRALKEDVCTGVDVLDSSVTCGVSVGGGGGGGGGWFREGGGGGEDLGGPRGGVGLPRGGGVSGESFRRDGRRADVRGSVSRVCRSGRRSDRAARRRDASAAPARCLPGMWGGPPPRTPMYRIAGRRPRIALGPYHRTRRLIIYPSSCTHFVGTPGDDASFCLGTVVHRCRCGWRGLPGDLHRAIPRNPSDLSSRQIRGGDARAGATRR